MPILGLPPAMRTSASDRWFTPPDLHKQIVAFLGDEYHDPCPPSLQGDQIKSGLWQSWKGQRIYVNPPYGRAITAWIRKATTEDVEELILLAPARTDTKWFQPLYDHTICFIAGRLRFSGATENAPFASVLVYRGERVKDFAHAFDSRGAILQRLASHRCKQTRLL